MFCLGVTTIGVLKGLRFQGSKKLHVPQNIHEGALRFRVGFGRGGML